MNALRRRYGYARTPVEEADRWSQNTRDWWARAEREAPGELKAYRRVRKGPASRWRPALKRLKEALQ